MDAREVEAWLKNRLVEQTQVKPDAVTEEKRTPMTDMQWRKLYTLHKEVSFGAWYNDKRFVVDMVNKPYDYPMTQKQSDYLEKIWQRFSRQVTGKLCPPRWIVEYTAQQWLLSKEGKTFSVQTFEQDKEESAHQDYQRILSKAVFK